MYKTVKEEWHLDYRIKIYAKYIPDVTFSIERKWYNGAVLLKGTVYDLSGEAVLSYDYNRAALDSDNIITYKPIYRRFLPFTIKRVEHISEVYERELNNLEQKLKRMIN